MSRGRAGVLGPKVYIPDNRRRTPWAQVPDPKSLHAGGAVEWRDPRTATGRVAPGGATPSTHPATGLQSLVAQL